MKFLPIFRSISGAAITALMALSMPSAALAQECHDTPPLTLTQAVTIALEKNPERKAALADTRVAAADVNEARSSLLPRVAFSETATRGNDQVFVFGSKLRQQRFTTADFSLNLLNTPPPLNNYSSRFGATWNLFDTFASWRGIHRAELAKEAAEHQLERAAQEVVFGVVNCG